MRSVIETLIREGTLLCLFFLPKERRIAIERRIRGRFEWQKLQGCDVVIVSFGKSGRTWLRVMMSRLYQKRYGLPERMLLQYDNMHRRRNEVPKVHYSHDNYLKDYTGNAADKFRQIDWYVTWRLFRLMVKKRGRNLRAGQADQWTEEWFNGHGLYRLRGTIRYPKAA